MGTKPPQSKAQKKSHKTAKKLPGHIAKRFRQKREESLKDGVVWADKEVQSSDATTVELKVSEEPPRLLDMARSSKKSKKQNTANSNRSMLAKVRDTGLEALISMYGKKK